MCKAMEKMCEDVNTKARVEIAQKALQSKTMSPEQVADLVGLPLEKVLSLCRSERGLDGQNG